MFAVMTAEITVLSLCALLCAAASLKLKISFCADQSLGSLCADLHVGKARAAKIRLFSAGNSFYGQVNASDPKKLRFEMMWQVYVRARRNYRAFLRLKRRIRWK